MKLRCLIVLIVSVGLSEFGCGPGGSGNVNTNDSTGNTAQGSSVISGRLSVIAQEERDTFLETEPNDEPNEVHALATVTPGDRIEIFGDVSEDTGDVTDTFKFESEVPLTIQVILSFDFDDNIDIAIGLTDSQPASCVLGLDDQAYSECHDTDKNPERPVLEVDGNFTIAVKLLEGTTNYVMGLEFFEEGTEIDPSSARWVSAHTTPHADFVPGQVVVKFEPHVGETVLQEIIRTAGLRILQRYPAGHMLLEPADQAQRSVLARRTLTLHNVRQLAATSGVRYAEPNYRYQPARVPNDEFFPFQWHYDLINLPEAWDITVGSANVVLAVVDTGILSEHPDLQGRTADGFDFISDAASARDGDGIDPDPTDAGDLAGGPNSSSYHGTHVAGTIAATTNNTEGVAGVTWDCTLMPIRALGVGGGSSTDIAEALRYAAGIANASGQFPSQAADAINMSLAAPAGSPPSFTIQDALVEAVARGTVVVVAAGNESSDQPSFPSAFDEAISVSACDPQLNLAPYSNFGPTVELSAPGGNLAVDLTGDGQGDGVLSTTGSDQDGGVTHAYSFQHGTSMATPHVTGVVGLMRSVNPDLTVEEIREILAETASDVGNLGRDDEFGFGVIDAALAVQEAAVRAGQAQPTEPILSLSTTALDFGSTLDALFVLVTNTGGGILEIDPDVGVNANELKGSGWLDFEVQTSSGSSNVSAIILRVDRSALADGEYLGRITVLSADGQSAGIQVSMTVGEGDPISDEVFVVAIDAETRVSIAQDVTTAARDFEYAIQNLPPGTYKVYAGTDRDLDDQICDLGELCGALPSAIRAEEIKVEEDEVITGIDFAVGELIFQTQSARQRTITPIRLLDQTPARPIESGE